MSGPDGLFDLDGRLAVIAGAARGIGKAAAAALADHGAALVLLDRLGDELRATADELVAQGADVHAVIGDVTDPAARDRLVATARERGTASVLVNAAGVIARTPVTEPQLADLDWMWQVNVTGTVALTQAVLPGMIEQRYGKVINVGSLGSVRGLERRTAYATTKGAVAQYTVSLASEVGCHGVRVNAVAPGYVHTDMASSWIYGNPERTERLRQRIPLGKFASAADLRGVFVFLAAPASDYVTGQILLADGGWTTT